MHSATPLPSIRRLIGVLIALTVAVALAQASNGRLQRISEQVDVFEEVEVVRWFIVTVWMLVQLLAWWGGASWWVGGLVG